MVLCKACGNELPDKPPFCCAIDPNPTFDITGYKFGHGDKTLIARDISGYTNACLIVAHSSQTFERMKIVPV